MLIIWLQGIWLPLHGYSYEDTPLWAGIYMLPITVGFLIAGPISGALSDRSVRAAFATGRATAGRGRASSACCCSRSTSATGVRRCYGAERDRLGHVLGAEPHRDHEQRAGRRSAAPRPGWRGTFLNAGSSLSIGIFFSLMIAGLAATLPATLYDGPDARTACRAAVAARSRNQPPVGSLFAAFLGYNPIQTLLGPTGVLAQLPTPMRRR